MSATLGPADAAVLETFVVPRYLSLYGEAALELFLSGDSADVVHLGCRTGYPDQLIADRMRRGAIVGVDASASAIDLARAKGMFITSMHTEYEVAEKYPTELEAGAFTHGLCLHPAASGDARREVIAELARLIMPAGQVLLALPMRGSFQEMTDLLREYALKHDAGEVGKAIELAAASRPNIEVLHEELDEVGFERVDIDLRPVTLEFKSGRDFLEDPITRLMVLPDLLATMKVEDLAAPLAYVREAIDKYWSEGSFELSVNVGCASGRRMA